MVDRAFGGIDNTRGGPYIVAQIVGGCLGAIVANVMFDLPAVELSTTVRSSGALWLSEVVATMACCSSSTAASAAAEPTSSPSPSAVWIGGAYWFTSSTSFANPAVTIARTLTDTFAGIAPASAPMFIVMQIVGAAASRCTRLFRYHRPGDIRPGSDAASRRRIITENEGSPRCRDLIGTGHRPAAQRCVEHGGAPPGTTSSTASSAIETIELFLATSYDQFAERAKFNNFLPLMAERFARQRLQGARQGRRQGQRRPPHGAVPLHPQRGPEPDGAGLVRTAGRRPGRGLVRGSEPGLEVNPAAVEAMAEVGIDITNEFPKPWTEEIVRAADVVITMGCGDACPLYPGKRYEDWELEDPAGLDVVAVRPIRDEIRSRVGRLIASLDLAI